MKKIIIINRNTKNVFFFYFRPILILGENMKNNKRLIRQEKLAKLFYEMGMELEVVSKISGVDIIIDDFGKEDYSIIEINDNPGYSINEWPYEPNEGRGVKIGLYILKLLGYDV